MDTWTPIGHPDRPLSNALIVMYVPDGQYLFAPGRDYEAVLEQFRKEEKPLPSHWRMMYDQPDGLDEGSPT